MIDYLGQDYSKCRIFRAMRLKSIQIRGPFCFATFSYNIDGDGWVAVGVYM